MVMVSPLSKPSVAVPSNVAFSVFPVKPSDVRSVPPVWVTLPATYVTPLGSASRTAMLKASALPVLASTSWKVSTSPASAATDSVNAPPALLVSFRTVLAIVTAGSTIVTVAAFEAAAVPVPSFAGSVAITVVSPALPVPLPSLSCTTET